MTIDNAIIGGLFALVSGYMVHSYRDSIAMRSEYKERCGKLEEDLKHVHSEILNWREKYFQMTEENGRLKNKIRALQIQLDDIHEKFIPEERKRIYRNA